MQLDFFNSKEFENGNQVFQFEFIQADPHAINKFEPFFQSQTEQLMQSLVQLKVESFVIKQLASVCGGDYLF